MVFLYFILLSIAVKIHKPPYMNFNLARILPFSLISIAAFTSCQKTNFTASEELTEDLARSANNKKCDAAEFRSVYGATGNLENKVHYQKVYDNRGNITKITAVIHNGGSIATTTSFEIVRKGRTLSFVKEGSSDTAFVVALNNKGQALSTNDGNKPDFQFLPTSFTYSNGMVSTMQIHFIGKELVSDFKFRDGNLIAIEDHALAGEIPGRIEYEYNTGNTVNKQYYFDEPRKFTWNTFTLLQVMGLFPELDGKSLRTRAIVYWENNYKAYDRKIVNHQLDGNGRLLQYAVTSPADGEISMRYFLGWNCSANELIASTGETGGE